MHSLSTELSETVDAVSRFGWIFYDRDCRSCSDLAARFAHVFAKRGFSFEPLQEKWVHHALGLTQDEALAEMRVLTRAGTVFAGADAIIFLARQVWWMSPLAPVAQLPGARDLLRRAYRWIAAHRHCSITPPRANRTSTAWLPLVALTALTLAIKPIVPPWAFMWAMAFAIFAGCKWLTLRLAVSRSPDPCPFHSAAYLFAWPGMDAARFLCRTAPPPPPDRVAVRLAALAFARMAIGALLLFVVARRASDPLLIGWIGMIGVVLFLHFGLFDLLSVAWRKVCVDAPPIMNAPLRSRSVAEFWSRRWNAAFNQLAMRFVFQPLARRAGPTAAAFAAFTVSGLVHELLISVPANGGYGLPTAYFLLQGAALLIERRVGATRLFTMIIVAAPAFWLFHPPFVRRVVLPFMQAIGAL